jgi:nitrogen regulatory protein P-II 1
MSAESGKYSWRKLMKKIEAIIQPHKLDEVREALKTIGIDGVTVSEVRGHGRQKGHKEIYRGREYQVDLVPKVKLELVVAASRTEEVTRALAAAAHSGSIGDGKIFVSEIEDAIRIRNDERGETAL